MKIALITGSARINGNTNRMADAFQQEAEKLGIEILKVDSTKLNIGPCTGCCQCYSNGKPCVFNDDFNQVFPEIAQCDGQVWCAPLYWYTFPAKPKALMDKYYSYYTAWRKGQGILMEGKKVALISACEEETADYFQGMEYAFDTSFALLKAETVGKVLIPDTNAIGDIEKTDGEEQARALVHKFL